MAFFEDLKGKATDLVQSGVAKSMQLAEIAKLKTANMGEEDTIKKAYIELGKLYYAENGAVAGGAYAAACERITAAKAAIETNNDRITQLKATAGEPEDASVEVEVKAAAEESNVTEFPVQAEVDLEVDIEPEEPKDE
ncbi:MAG: serine proteinase [Oscillospiraceae bacterium]|jgi:hypothetical protein|nr:serine proteinase [Oscillospiraceae bacterium]MCI9393974.1 serine proteinase [Oscillospiraceae bacterium]MCI9580300.1 serine proteinase [Oscillospiraceae bacterium]